MENFAFAIVAMDTLYNTKQVVNENSGKRNDDMRNKETVYVMTSGFRDTTNQHFHICNALFLLLP